jgi:hypothetical protein
MVPHGDFARRFRLYFGGHGSGLYAAWLLLWRRVISNPDR